MFCLAILKDTCAFNNPFHLKSRNTLKVMKNSEGFPWPIHHFPHDTIEPQYIVKSMCHSTIFSGNDLKEGLLSLWFLFSRLPLKYFQSQVLNGKLQNKQVLVSNYMPSFKHHDKASCRLFPFHENCPFSQHEYMDYILIMDSSCLFHSAPDVSYQISCYQCSDQRHKIK